MPSISNYLAYGETALAAYALNLTANIDNKAQLKAAGMPEAEVYMGGGMTARCYNPTRVRLIAFIAILFASAFLAGYGDKDGANKYIQELCTKDAGVMVYETVKLPANQFDKWGMPRGKDWDQSVKVSTLDPAYASEISTETLKKGDPLKGEVEIWRLHQRILRKVDGKLLAEAISYGRRGGDPYLALLLGGHPSGEHCPQQTQSLISLVFIHGE